MIKIGKYKIYFGDFHGQWNSSKEELALLPAGLSYYGYDFTIFQTPSIFPELKNIIDSNEIDIIPFKGLECMYEWGHLTTANIIAEPPSKDNPNVEEVLSWFQKNSDWTILAHPYKFMIDRMENLIDQKLLNAIELVNGFINVNEHLVEWYYSMINKGKKIPIVSGLDIHIPNGSCRPSILYSPFYKPEEDIKLFRSNRSGVICENCDIRSIKNSISSCQTFIEIAEEQRLIGPPEITEYLEGNGYWDTVTDDIEQRKVFIPETESLLIAGEKSSFSWSSKPDAIIIDGKSQICEDRKINIPIPVKYERNTHYINMVSVDGKKKTVNAMKVYHPLKVNIYSDLEGGKCTTIINIENVTDKNIEDLFITISCDNQRLTRSVGNLKVNENINIVNEWNIDEPSRPTLFSIQIKTSNYSKNIDKYLVFCECKYIENIHDSTLWDTIPIITMTGNNSEQIDKAFTVYWNGDDDLSATIKMAWNENGIYFKINVVDDFLVASKTDLLMFGDSFQIGLNPVGTEAVGNQSFYDIMMTRGTETDNEKAYMERAVNMALEYPINKRVLLKGLYDTKMTEDGFEGLLTLPFNRITPMIPIEGYRFGLYMVIFDNDGSGLKTSLQWPLSSEKYIKQAWYIPYGGAWATIKLSR